jgi:vacuolar-type H+-ATPase subunit D/Vma8
VGTVSATRSEMPARRARAATAQRGHTLLELAVAELNLRRLIRIRPRFPDRPPPGTGG